MSALDVAPAVSPARCAALLAGAAVCPTPLAAIGHLAKPASVGGGIGRLHKGGTQKKNHGRNDDAHSPSPSRRCRRHRPGRKRMHAGPEAVKAASSPHERSEMRGGRGEINPGCRCAHPGYAGFAHPGYGCQSSPVVAPQLSQRLFNPRRISLNSLQLGQASPSY